MDSVRFTSSELQHQGSSLKGTSVIQGEIQVTGIKVRAGDSFLLDGKVGTGHCLFSEPSTHRGTEPQSQLYLRLHQPG